MKKIVFAMLGIALFVSSCKKSDDMKMTPTMDNMTPSTTAQNINYPAAYVVNGGSNSVSVIKLSDNTVTATLDLTKISMSGMGDMSTNITWPHHVYINSAKTQ
ncbi:MAG: hypothetical protein K2Q22_01165, partial [Cytophagales bacterium]|nr:hypothetical protein [Cytophagales bacterium]